MKRSKSRPASFIDVEAYKAAADAFAQEQPNFPHEPAPSTLGDVWLLDAELSQAERQGRRIVDDKDRLSSADFSKQFPEWRHVRRLARAAWNLGAVADGEILTAVLDWLDGEFQEKVRELEHCGETCGESSDSWAHRQPLPIVIQGLQSLTAGPGTAGDLLLVVSTVVVGGILDAAVGERPAVEIILPEPGGAVAAGCEVVDGLARPKAAAAGGKRGRRPDTERDIEIAKALDDGRSQDELARQYGLTTASAISKAGERGRRALAERQIP